ncbi:copper transporter [Spiractinospora alimapuensis]|uniref:copper transporter n=1 Tax=Spiractinospora alimapuensis TaxID=2820884 RepID=UPI0022AACC1A|nr:copper transporter [Spiractinospora alimapuensis]QVQ52300.1 copper transporter [Spiractinospora alimapuensis]
MIDFRYHLVSLVGVFLALTVGIVLGSTMLQDPLLDRLNADAAQMRDEAEELRAEKDAADRRYAGVTALVAAWSGDMVADQLDDERVVIVEAPGVDATTRDQLADQVTAAGATMTGRVSFTERYLDPAEAPHVRDLTDDLVSEPELDSPELPRAVPTSGRPSCWHPSC